MRFDAEAACFLARCGAMVSQRWAMLRSGMRAVVWRDAVMAFVMDLTRRKQTASRSTTGVLALSEFRGADAEAHLPPPAT